MDTEESVPAQHFRVPVLKVEGVVWNYGRGVDERFVIGRIFERGVGGSSAIRSIGDREVGERGDADGRRPSDGCDGRFMS